MTRPSGVCRRTTRLDRRGTYAALLAGFPRLRSFIQMAPDGNVYVLEPFESQKTLANQDLSFRDYYQRASASGRAS